MTSTETRVATICAEILGLAYIDLDDDFYEVGSDSHQAVLVALEIESTFRVDLPLEVMETTANVRTLAAWVDEQLSRQTAAMAPSASQAGSTLGD